MCGNHARISRIDNSIRCYYKCQGKKEHRGCTGKSIQRDIVEKIVLDNTINIILQDYFINMIADKITEYNNLEDESEGLINAFKNELKDIKNKIKNIITAIENGVASKRMMERLSELETREEEVDELIKIEKKKITYASLTKEQIIFWLTMFKEGDIHSSEFCDKLINLFIDKVIVYANKVEIHYNYMDKGHQQSMCFFEQPVLDTETHITIGVSPSLTLVLGKNTFYLESLL